MPLLRSRLPFARIRQLLLYSYFPVSQLVGKWVSHGRGPRGTGGTVPPKYLRLGDGPCIRPPNILRSSVCRMRAKAITHSKDMENLKRDRKNMKNMVDD